MTNIAPQVLGAIVRRFGDFASAEDAVQDALVAAAAQWPSEGVPANPRAWLLAVASRRMIDHRRSEAARRRRELVVAETSFAEEAEAQDERDDTLDVLFLCAHPSLTAPSAIALTLRAVGGLTTAQIAKAFLVPESTMAQRISRAKQTIKASGVSFGSLDESERGGRLTAVLHVLYLMFNEGYTSSDGDDLQRPDLAREAIRLARTVRALLPDHTEIAGLTALMLLTDARRTARASADGALIPLAKQDRSLWNRADIEEGVALISATLRKGNVGPYQLQAAIAAIHDEAVCSDDTDWPQLLALYDLLGRMSDNPMVALNYAIVAAMVHGPARGLELLSALDADDRLAKNNHRLSAARAHLYEMAGEREAAIAHFRAAATRAANVPERNYLLTQAARLSNSSS